MTQKTEIKRCYSCGSINVSIRDFGSGGQDGFCEDCGANDFLSKWNRRVPEDDRVKEIIGLENTIGKLVKIIGELEDNAICFDQELEEANKERFLVWEEPNESSHAHICHLQLMERLKREFSI
jgi:hypothetical protein